MFPVDKVILKTVVNPESVQAFKAGALAQNTLVSGMVRKALKRLGFNANSYRYEQNGDKLNIVIEISKK